MVRVQSNSLTGSSESRSPQTKGTGKGACETQNQEPDGVPDSKLHKLAGPHCAALERPPSTPEIRSQASGAQKFSRIGDRPNMIPAARETKVTLSYLVVPHTLHSEWMVAIVVVLVDRQNSRGSINDRHARAKDIPSQPIIPTNAANHEGRNFLVVEPAREGKIIGEPAISLPVFGYGTSPCFLSPVRICEFYQLLYLRVPAAADH